jgi:hypothetical protein
VTVPRPDFNNDGFGDLAVGVPGEDIGAVADAGALNVLSGLDGVGTELLTQADAAGTVEAGDAFGAALSDPFFHQGVSGLGGVAESTDVFAAALS